MFFAGNAIRVVKTLRMPVLRWELYPIPKGPRDRQLYGGSYFEESDLTVFGRPRKRRS